MIIDTIENKKGIPLMAYGEKTLITTTSYQSKKFNEKLTDTFFFDGTEYVSWGENNIYPEEAIKTISEIGVLSAGIDFRCRTCAGSGVIPVTIEGYDEKYQEIVKPFNNKDVIKHLRSYNFRNHHFEMLRDIFKLGNTFPILIFNNKGDKIVRIDTINARHCRLSVDKTRVLVFADWKNGSPDKSNAVVYEMLDEKDPFYDLQKRKETNKLKNKPLFFPRIKNYFSNADYYAHPAWDTAWKSGWIDVYKQVPIFLKNAYKNAMNLMWHIQIPYSYWEEKYPEETYQNAKERADMIKKDMEKIEECLTGDENANKALINGFTANEMGRIEDKWQLDRLNNKIETEDRLNTSAAANGEILFSMLVNPAALGIGTTAGNYSGSAGSGSDIREAFMVSLVLNYMERCQILDPTELMLQYNGYDNIDIKYKNILLTTLDTGKSSKEQID